MTSHDPELTSNSLNWPPELKIAKRIGMLHIIWKLKTAVLQRKYVQPSLRSNDWPRADIICDFIGDSLFPVLDHMTSNDHILTSNDFLWPSMKRKVSIIIAKKIGVLHNKWKLKTTVFEHIHEEYQKKPENLRTLYVTYLLLFWIIWPLLTLNWTLMALIKL